MPSLVTCTGRPFRSSSGWMSKVHGIAVAMWSPSSSVLWMTMELVHFSNDSNFSFNAGLHEGETVDGLL